MSRILVLGGTGFVGRHVVARLCAAGHDVLVPTRRRERGKALLPLPTVDVVQEDVHEAKSLEALVRRRDAVVNLIGILHERGRETFARAHVELARKLVAACRNAGVQRIVHMSALTAAPDAPSSYLRSKGEAQALIETSGLKWTVFCPSVIFGRGDSFLSRFAKLVKWLPVVALASPDARFQPVHVGDVAQCFAQAVVDDHTIGQRYELCGPKTYTLRELVEWVAETTGHVRPIIALGPALSRFQARVLEVAPGKLLTRDNLASMSVPNVCSGAFPAVFGIEPVALEAIALDYLAPTANRSRYDRYRTHSGR